MSTLPSRRASAFSTAWRMNLLVSLSCVCSAAPTSGRLNRDRMLMMCTRAIGSLPPSRLISSGTMARVGDLADDAKQRRLLGRLLGVGVLQQLAGVEPCLLRGQDAHDLPLRHVGLLEQVVEHGRRVVLGAAHRPDDGRHGALVAVLEPFGDDRERPLRRACC